MYDPGAPFVHIDLRKTREKCFSKTKRFQNFSVHFYLIWFCWRSWILCVVVKRRSVEIKKLRKMTKESWTEVANFN